MRKQLQRVPVNVSYIYVRYHIEIKWPCARTRACAWHGRRPRLRALLPSDRDRAGPGARARVKEFEWLNSALITVAENGPWATRVRARTRTYVNVN